jgi:hypothetical protein
MAELTSGILFPEQPETTCHAAFSFPSLSLGTEGPPNIAVALFSFTSTEAYDRYRLAVSDDEGCNG